MGDLIAADLMIQEGVDEFRLAAAKTAQGIIEQGLAVLKIKQGCEVKQGGTDFPEVAMRELGLSKQMASKLAGIGEAANKLSPVGDTLPAESVSTLYLIARMDEATIADKIERGVITPTASRADVQEQVRKERIVSPAIAELGDVVDADEVQKIFATLGKRQQAVLEKHMTDTVENVRKVIQKEYDDSTRAVRERQAKESTKLASLRASLERQERVAATPFTKSEFKLIKGMLHPDRHQGEAMKGKADKAFNLFNRIEKFCRKDNLTRKAAEAFAA